jgi:hypothetical protein
MKNSLISKKMTGFFYKNWNLFAAETENIRIKADFYLKGVIPPPQKS